MGSRESRLEKRPAKPKSDLDDASARTRPGLQVLTRSSIGNSKSPAHVAGLFCAQRGAAAAHTGAREDAGRVRTSHPHSSEGTPTITKLCRRTPALPSGALQP